MQLNRQFANLSRFQCINFVHWYIWYKFEERKAATVREQRLLKEELRELYPFAVEDVTATEYNLNVLYNNREISLLLAKLICERDSLAAKKKARQQKRVPTGVESGNEAAANPADANKEDTEEQDRFAVYEGVTLRLIC